MSSSPPPSLEPEHSPEAPSDPAQHNTKKAPRPARMGRNLVVGIQLLLAALLVVLGFFATIDRAPRFDLTAQKELSLSAYTTQLLGSDSLQERENPVLLTCFAVKSSPHFSRIKTLLQEYERQGQGQVKVDFVDPLLESQRAFRLLKKYEVAPTEDTLIIDAQDREPSLAHIRYLALADFIEYEVTDRKQRRVSGYEIEDQVTTALLAALEGTMQTAYLVTNNTKAEDLAEGSVGDALSGLLRTQNIDLQALSLSEVQSVPQEASLLIFLKPQYDLEPKELKLVLKYWERPRGALLFLLDPQKRPKRIRAFLRRHGITQRDDRLVQKESRELATKVSATFTRGPALNESLQGKSTIFEGLSSTLEVREAAEDLLNARIAPIALIEASPTYYGESRHRESPYQYEAGEDHQEPLYLGAAVIRGNEMNDQTAGQSSRLIALSTVDFLSSTKRREEQNDFLKNSINWLVGRPELVGLGPRTLQTYKLNLLSPEVQFINRLTLLILPAGFLLMALMVWNSRRS